MMTQFSTTKSLFTGLLLLTLIPLLASSQAEAGLDMIPAARRVDWSNMGVDGGIPNLPIVANVLDFGATGNGNTDDAAAFQSAIDSVNGTGAVYVPAGTYLIQNKLDMPDGVALRGAGPDLTHLNIDHSQHAVEFITYERGTWVDAVSGYSKGSTSLTVADASEFIVGEYGELQQDNDPALMYTDPAWNTSWATASVGQLFKVVAVSGNTITIDPPLHIDYRSDLNPVVRAQGFRDFAGVENLHIKRLDSSDTHMFYLKNAANIWITNVHSQLAAKSHVSGTTAFRLEIRDSYFEDATNFGGGGHGYGVEFGFHTTASLVQNNVFRRLRHAMMVHIGANGNVFGYNYSTITQSEGSWLPPDISIHGHYPFSNLFEGNIVEEVGIGDYWGPAGLYNTYFRNRVETDETLNVYDASHTQNLVGNEVVVEVITITDNAQDLLIHGNREQGILSWDPNISDQDLPDSYYLSSKPDFYGNMVWPSLGADIPGGTNPAKERYLSGNPTGPTPTPPATNTPGPSPTPTNTATPTNTPTPQPTADPTSGLKVQYQVGDSSASDNAAKPLLQIVNTGNGAPALSDLTIRYWFSKDHNQPLNYWCDYAVVNCANVTAVFGDNYLELGFTSGAGSLAPGQNSGQIKSRFSYNNWANHDETNDYSYDSSKTSFADWDHVTLYYSDILVWGIAPGGFPPPTATPALPTATTIPPTATTVPPTATSAPPTATSVPPTATAVPPTATTVPPTATTISPTNTPIPPTATAVPPTATPNPGGVSCTVTYDIVNQWNNGFQVNITITNNSSSPIQGYDLVWDFLSGEAYGSGWNATYSQSGSTATASNIASHWNGTIQANGGSVGFGFNGSHSGTVSIPTNFIVNGNMCN